MIQYDHESQCVMVNSKMADRISTIIMGLSNIDNESIIIDATASIGGNTFSFSKYFDNVIGTVLFFICFTIYLYDLKI